VIRVQYERLKESEKIKDEFINTAAHELRTPIQPILGLTDIVRSRIITLNGSIGRVIRDGDNATKRAEGVLLLLDVITRNAKRLKQLTDNILDVTKIESHSFKLNKERFNIEQLIEETAEEQNLTISNTIITNTEIKILLGVSNKEMEDIADIGTATKITAYKSANRKVSGKANSILESFLIDADKTKISQVLSNLLSNALSSIRLKAGTEEGRITISVSRTDKSNWKNKIGVTYKSHDQNSNSDSDDEIIVSITDNGQGIPPDVAQNLFTKFVSGSDSGTGLGLYISKNIVEAHGGRIWASNNDPIATANETDAITTTGATFSFTLPVLEIVTKSK
jgi:signal transduction histidine kinase